MKKKLQILSSILILALNSQAKVFVPFEDGFVEKQVNVEKKSINNICKFLGYNTEQSHSYMDFDKIGGDIITVIFKTFTESVICVITNDEVEVLSKEEVNKYLINFSFSEEYDAYQIESILSDGIKNNSLTSDFFEEIFVVSSIEKNGSYTAPIIGYELKFTNGKLSSFNSSDGLNKWAKEWKNKNPSVYSKYEQEANKFWGEDKNKILNEINVQADAYARTPDAAGNEYTNFHRTLGGVVNYKMLLVAHYNEKINLSEFKEVNYGRYEIVDEFNESGGYKRTTYKVNEALFTFNETGELVNSYTSK